MVTVCGCVYHDSSITSTSYSSWRCHTAEKGLRLHSANTELERASASAKPYQYSSTGCLSAVQMLRSVLAKWRDVQ
eukprot:1161130-Pelagomonas_calceolata.AAC.9